MEKQKIKIVATINMAIILTRDNTFLLYGRKFL